MHSVPSSTSTFPSSIETTLLPQNTGLSPSLGSGAGMPPDCDGNETLDDISYIFDGYCYGFTVSCGEPLVQNDVFAQGRVAAAARFPGNASSTVSFDPATIKHLPSNSGGTGGGGLTFLTQTVNNKSSVETVISTVLSGGSAGGQQTESGTSDVGPILPTPSQSMWSSTSIWASTGTIIRTGMSSGFSSGGTGGSGVTFPTTTTRLSSPSLATITTINETRTLTATVGSTGGSGGGGSDGGDSTLPTSTATSDSSIETGPVGTGSSWPPFSISNTDPQTGQRSTSSPYTGLPSSDLPYPYRNTTSGSLSYLAQGATRPSSGTPIPSVNDTSRSYTLSNTDDDRSRNRTTPTLSGTPVPSGNETTSWQYTFTNTDEGRTRTLNRSTVSSGIRLPSGNEKAS
ncbi:hypothetical protein P152DRAFT_451700 [Eremomyces bilateralis CBS 781.70]|uniref:Uncharacterized protein n=1 Tax=Eremomyces bilateralis CBS 781.70 TaxID=1392243 RepID=A0A6G1FVA2_9PEZI|nr:uncharacterized protein P152DRAFT_451700 [Eremomyces bilateralis CBS 781.70]KAF1809747.1 hypothetical protein P152DRAFT_451700 [Eremomyces bilateralis CBS 781.70]